MCAFPEGVPSFFTAAAADDVAVPAAPFVATAADGFAAAVSDDGGTVPAIVLAGDGVAAGALRGEWDWSKIKQAPEHLPLYQLTVGDARDAARVICCHQDIAADSCFAVGFLTEFADPLEGTPWVYRELFWETGLLGQTLYLEAEAAGIRATGIGCFFDDAMHRLLGLDGLAWQSLYHFTVGGPVEDRRVRNLPPYAHLRRS